MISVAICTYNGECFIEEQLCSILNQSMLVDEIVVCDDRSSDSTIDIINRISSRTQIPIRIYINETNLGCVRNFGKAISLCNGGIIFLSDQDDIWEHNKVETIIKWFDKHPNKDVVISNAILIDAIGNQVTSETYFSLYFDEYSRSLFDNGFGIELFANRNRACGATMAIRKEVGNYLSNVINNQQYASTFQRCLEYNIIHDYIMAFKAICEGKLGYIEEVLTRYRQHESQVCGVGEIRKITSDEAYLIDYYKDDCLCCLPLTDKAKIRVEFIFWRSKLKKKVYAPVLVLLRFNQYMKLYGSLKWKFMKYDSKESLQKTRERLRLIYSRWFNPKVKRVFISYGDDNFAKSLKRIRREAQALNIFDKIITYTPEDLSIEIRQSPLMKYKRGGGYWLWKAYVICKTMEMYPNAIVVYTDAGCTLNKNYTEWNSWFKLMESTDTLLTYYRPDFDYGWKELFGTSSVKISTWTKRLTVDYFDKCFGSTNWHNNNKIWGGFIIAKNNSSFVCDVLNTMLKHPELVRDPEGNEINKQYDGFCAHRHDQSIITPLAYWYEKKYPQIVKIIPETAESIRSSAVVTTRIKDKDIPSLASKVVMKLKTCMGKKVYNSLFFWNK